MPFNFYIEDGHIWCYFSDCWMNIIEHFQFMCILILITIKDFYRIFFLTKAVFCMVFSHELICRLGSDHRGKIILVKKKKCYPERLFLPKDQENPTQQVLFCSNWSCYEVLTGYNYFSTNWPCSIVAQKIDGENERLWKLCAMLKVVLTNIPLARFANIR